VLKTIQFLNEEIPFFGIFIILYPNKVNIMFHDSTLNSNKVIMIFQDKEKQREPLCAIWKERKQRWYITKVEDENETDIRNAKEVLSATEFVKALESGRY
jgi:ABC-type dipeptide/oligopeptide/nickel transport system ATPase component